MPDSKSNILGGWVLVGLLLATDCLAKPADTADLALARSLMPPGHDLAGLQRRRLEGSPYVLDWSHEAVRTNLVVRDLDGDGRKDLFMVVEANPRRVDGQGNTCPDSDTSCQIEWGGREIQAHFRKRDGSYRLVANRGGLMMGTDEGGMDSDPFKGLVQRPDGTIEVHFHGGAGWVWSHRIDVRYLKDDLYIVRLSRYSASMDSVWTQDADLLRRKWKTERSAISEEATKPRVRRGSLPKSPLPRFSLADVEMDPCGQWPSGPVDSTWESPKGFSCDQPRPNPEH